MITFAELLDLALQICAGMCYIHAKQIVHRDLNPSNILISGGSGGAKLCDFGLARTVAQDRDAGVIARHREARSSLDEVALTARSAMPIFSPQRLGGALARLGGHGPRAAAARATAQNEAELAHEGGTPGYTAPEVVASQLRARNFASM